MRAVVDRLAVRRQLGVLDGILAGCEGFGAAESSGGGRALRAADFGAATHRCGSELFAADGVRVQLVPHESAGTDAAGPSVQTEWLHHARAEGDHLSRGQK